MILEATTGRMVAAGVNLVRSFVWSGAHAEMVAIALSQRRLGLLDLGADATETRVLVSCTEPCAMCLGAVTWSGVRRLVCGVSDADARAIGFDEGIKANDWPERLRQHGIGVRQGGCRAQAIDVPNAYQEG